MVEEYKIEKVCVILTVMIGSSRLFLHLEVIYIMSSIIVSCTVSNRSACCQECQT